MELSLYSPDPEAAIFLKINTRTDDDYKPFKI